MLHTAQKRKKKYSICTCIRIQIVYSACQMWLKKIMRKKSCEIFNLKFFLYHFNTEEHLDWLVICFCRVLRQKVEKKYRCQTGFFFVFLKSYTYFKKVKIVNNHPESIFKNSSSVPML